MAAPPPNLLRLGAPSETIDPSSKPTKVHLLRSLGHGSFGHIFTARLLDHHDGLVDAPVALKVFKTPSSIQDEAAIRKEIKFSMMLSKLASETTPIVKTLHAYAAKGRDVAYLVRPDQGRDACERRSMKGEDPMRFCMSMELCEGGSLLDFMKEIETSRAKDWRGNNWMREEEAARFLEPVAKALQFCHSHGLVHLDVKLANVLLKEKGKLETACLADFGVAKLIPSNMNITGMNAFLAAPGTGSKMYMAPEVATSGIYSPSADVFSLGCLLLVALTGFTSQSWYTSHGKDICGSPSRSAAFVEKHILDGCSYGQSQIRAWRRLSPAAKQLIAGMLCPDPLRRLSLDDVLRHPWLSSPKQQGKLKKAMTSLLWNLRIACLPNF